MEKNQNEVMPAIESQIDIVANGGLLTKLEISDRSCLFLKKCMHFFDTPTGRNSVYVGDVYTQDGKFLFRLDSKAELDHFMKTYKKIETDFHNALKINREKKLLNSDKPIYDMKLEAALSLIREGCVEAVARNPKLCESLPVELCADNEFAEQAVARLHEIATERKREAIYANGKTLIEKTHVGAKRIVKGREK